MSLKPIGLFLIVVNAALIFQGCSSPNNSGKKIDKLIFGISGGEDPTERLNCFRALAPYLEKEIGVKKIDFFVSSDYASIIEAMRAKKVDVAHLGELSYLLAVERAGAEAIVMASNGDDRRLSSSIILTSSKSGIKSMDEVRKRSKELSLAFGDPASTSGHLYPRNYLDSIGLNPEKSFKSVSFCRDHYTAILTAVSGKVDIACVFSLAMNKLILKKMLKKEDYIILWQSQLYISPPISVRGDLPKELKEKIKNAYLDLPKKQPTLWKNFKNVIYTIYPEEIRNKLIFSYSNDSMYNGIREAARSCKGFNFLNSK